jgi:hypothetical protein
VAAHFCIPYTLARGDSSLPPRIGMLDRFKKSGKEKLVIVVLSDFDPEGQDIAHSFARSMRDDFGISGVEPVKAALTESQIDYLHLVAQMKAKESSSRHAAYVARHGDDVFELEAVQPGDMQEILREAIESVMDLDAYDAEVEAGKKEVAQLEVIRKEMKEKMGHFLQGQQ